MLYGRNSWSKQGIGRTEGQMQMLCWAGPVMPGHPVGWIMTLLKAPNSPSLHKHVLPHLIFEKTRWGGLSVSFGRGMTGCPAFSFTKQEGKPLLAGRRKHIRDKREAWRAVGWPKHSGPNPQGCTQPANLQDEDWSFIIICERVGTISPGHSQLCSPAFCISRSHLSLYIPDDKLYLVIFSFPLKSSTPQELKTKINFRGNKEEQTKDSYFPLLFFSF